MLIKDLIDDDIRLYDVSHRTINTILTHFKKSEKLQEDVTRYNHKQIENILRDSICDYCQTYQSSKTSVVKVMIALKDQLKNKGYEIDLKEPDFHYANDTERQLFLLKFFHPDKKRTLQDAHEILWMYSERKLKNDITDINNNSLKFLGNHVKLQFDYNYIHMSSSVHPIFLVENLTQVLAQLEGLRLMGGTPLEDYAKKTAANIWFQLSDYARNRILFVLKDLMDQDVSYYLQLKKDDSIYVTEDQCSNIKGSHNVINCLKNEKSCYIAYYEGKKVKKVKCKIQQYYGDGSFKVLDIKNNEEVHINQKDIVCCVEKRKDFINYLN